MNRLHRQHRFALPSPRARRRTLEHPALLLDDLHERETGHVEAVTRIGNLRILFARAVLLFGDDRALQYERESHDKRICLATLAAERGSLLIARQYARGTLLHFLGELMNDVRSLLEPVETALLAFLQLKMNVLWSDQAPRIGQVVHLLPEAWEVVRRILLNPSGNECARIEDVQSPRPP